jgi:glycerophosphoryl diester phosphodiesterase
MQTRGRIATLMAIAALSWGSGVTAAIATCPPSPFRSARPLVIAHASSTFFGPGNTIEMMRAAVKAGADIVDADVRVTSDGALVAAHDDDLRSLTGTSGSIAHLPLSVVQQRDAGFTWPGPKGNFPLRGRHVHVPTVEQILNAFPGRRVSLEFKTTGGEQSMCTLLRQLHRTSDVYIGSAGDGPVDRFRPLCPEVTTTVTDALVEVMREVQTSGRAWCSPASIGQPPYAIGGRLIVTKESVDWDHAHGMGRADLARTIFDRIKR